MQVILDSSFRPPAFSPYMGREEKRVQELDYMILSKSLRSQIMDTEGKE